MIDDLKEFTDLFIKFEEHEIQELADFFKPLKVKKKDHIFVEGCTVKNMYFISKGILRAYCLKDGIDYTTTFIFGPCMFSDILSIRTKEPTMLNFQLLSECEVYECSFDKIEYLADTNPRFLFLFFKLYETLFLKGIERQQSFIFDTPKERYLKLFDIRPEVIAEIPQQYIASYLGFKPETLSRIRKNIASRES